MSLISESLYGKYLMEREEYSIIQDEKGFATFRIFGEECYVRDTYVLPEFRNSGIASSYCDKITEIAKKSGCKFLTGTVDPRASGSTASIKAVIAYGFKLHSSTQEKIVLVKEL